MIPLTSRNPFPLPADLKLLGECIILETVIIILTTGQAVLLIGGFGQLQTGCVQHKPCL